MIMGMVSMGLTIAMSFVFRKMFLEVLSVDYLGVTSLLNSIIAVLSLVELGFYSAVMYSLYKPLAEGDESKVSGILRYYKKIYTIVAGVVLVLGLAMIPLLPYFIKDMPVLQPSVNVIYLFILATTVASYFNAYKFTILLADQKEYIYNGIIVGCKLFSQGLQIALLFVFENYYVVIGLNLIIVFVQNIIFTIIVNKKYPYIKSNKHQLATAEKREINKYSSSMLMHKMGYIVLGSTDSIIITSFLGATALGMCSNYLTLHAALNQIIGVVFSAITASVGNYICTKSNKEQFKLFQFSSFAGAWLSMMAALGLFFVSNQFISLWLGPEYVLEPMTVAMLSLALYVENYIRSVGTFIGTKGLFPKTALLALLYVIVNLGFSILLIQFMGISGVYLGTVIARMCSYPFEVYILSKYGFEQKTWLIYKDALMHLFTAGLALAAMYGISLVNISNNWGDLFYRFILMLIVPNVIFGICFCRTKVMKQLFEMVKGKLVKSKTVKIKNVEKEVDTENAEKVVDTENTEEVLDTENTEESLK